MYIYIYIYLFIYLRIHIYTHTYGNGFRGSKASYCSEPQTSWEMDVQVGRTESKIVGMSSARPPACAFSYLVEVLEPKSPRNGGPLEEKTRKSWGFSMSDMSDMSDCNWSFVPGFQGESNHPPG